MAFTPQETTQLLALAQREGGVDPVATYMRTEWLKAKRQQILTALRAAVTVTVSDWSVVDQIIATAVPAAVLYPVKEAAEQRLAAHDTDGVLLALLLVAAEKAHRG
jgi:hypothetical protein